MKVGYARVSSVGQSLDTQIDKLTAFGCEKVFQEKRSGASRQKRDAVNAALEFCREGDVLVITKLDRLARSMFDLQDITKTLERKGVDFIVLDQSIDTTTPAGRLTFHLLGAVAEFERDLISERQAEGMHVCGNPNHPPNVIASGGQGIVDSRQVARKGDSCACGAVIIEGSSQSEDNGQPIAYQGCATQCGPYRGQITTGSPQAKVQP